MEIPKVASFRHFREPCVSRRICTLTGNGQPMCFPFKNHRFTFGETEFWWKSFHWLKVLTRKTTNWCFAWHGGCLKCSQGLMAQCHFQDWALYLALDLVLDLVCMIYSKTCFVRMAFNPGCWTSQNMFWCFRGFHKELYFGQNCFLINLWHFWICTFAVVRSKE